MKKAIYSSGLKIWVMIEVVINKNDIYKNKEGDFGE